MTTLPDFLLARIAEDESYATHDDTPHSGPGSTDRVLADCEAKRRIVELADDATGLDMQVDSEFRVGSRDEVSEPYVGDLILRALASVHSDHPDFQPAWRI